MQKLSTILWAFQKMLSIFATNSSINMIKIREQNLRKNGKIEGIAPKSSKNRGHRDSGGQLLPSLRLWRPSLFAREIWCISNNEIICTVFRKFTSNSNQRAVFQVFRQPAASNKNHVFTLIYIDFNESLKNLMGEGGAGKMFSTHWCMYNCTYYIHAYVKDKVMKPKKIEHSRTNERKKIFHTMLSPSHVKHESRFIISMLVLSIR